MIDRLIERIIELQNPTCVGLDTSFDYLPDEMKEGVTTFKGVADAIVSFNKAIIDEVYTVVPAVKVQIAYYEMYGNEGVRAFEETVAYAKQKGLFVIGDCKRNDIGSTASCYSKAYIGASRIGDCQKIVNNCDMLTVNGYLGLDGIQPFLDDMSTFDKGIFVLVKTSNPSSGEFQNLQLKDGQYVYEYMGSLVEKWGENFIGQYGYSAVGAVVGATHPDEAKRLREQLVHTFFLIPGYGAQGGKAEMLKCCFDNKGLGGIVNNSRAILTAYRNPKYYGMTFEKAAKQACIDMQKDLLTVIGKMG